MSFPSCLEAQRPEGTLKMPQLDPTAYFSEYLWTLLSFFGFYYFLSKFFLPEFARALLFEQKKAEKKPFGQVSSGLWFCFGQDPSGLWIEKNPNRIWGQWRVRFDGPKGRATPMALFQKKIELCGMFFDSYKKIPALLQSFNKNKTNLWESFLNQKDPS